MHMTMQTHQAALDELRRGFTGAIIVPNDPAYDEARTIFNAMIDRRPSIIAQCANVHDVVRAVHAQATMASRLRSAVADTVSQAGPSRRAVS
jgi:hypothetical protein